MAWSLVNKVNASATSSAISTVGADLIIIGVCDFSGGSTPTDNQGNVYTPVASITASGRQTLKLFYKQNPATAASHTFTAAGSNGYIDVQAWSGSLPSGSFDKATTDTYSSTGSTTTETTSSITPSGNNSLCVAFWATDDAASGGNTTYVVNSPYTLSTSGTEIPFSEFGSCFSYLVQSGAPTSTSATMVRSLALASGDNDVSVIASFLFNEVDASLTLPGAGMTMSAGTFGVSGDTATAFQPNAFQSLGFQILGGTTGGGGGNISLTLTGIGMSSGAGAFTKAIAGGVTGANALTGAGSFADKLTKLLGGASVSSGAGSFSKAITHPITGANAASAAGSFAKAVAHGITGANSSASPGNFTKKVAGGLTGSNAVTGSGAFKGALSKPLTGAGASSGAGSFSVSTGSNKNVTLTGAGATANAGSFSKAIAKLLAGAAATGTAGNFLHAVSINLPGVAGTAHAGSFAARAIARTLPGIGAIAQAGQLTVTGPAPPAGGNAEWIIIARRRGKR